MNEVVEPRASIDGPEGGVKKVRFMLESEDSTYKVATVAFGQSDASLYIFPGEYESGEGFAGQLMVPAPGGSNSFNFTRQQSGYPLKMTIHESGRTHAEAASGEVEPAWGRT